MKNWKTKVKYIDSQDIEIGNIWSNASDLQNITTDFIDLVSALDFNAIATIEAKGIIYGSALADRLGLPLLIFRKINKIRHTKDKIVHEFINWRGEKGGLEIENDLISASLKILVVDDLADTLNSFNAVNSILKDTQNTISGFLSFANWSGKSFIDKTKIYSLIKKVK